MKLVKHLLLLVLSYNLNCPDDYERDANDSHPFFVLFQISDNKIINDVFIML